MCHQKDPTFCSLALTERPPLWPTFTQWPPIFNKLLVTKRPWHIFVTQRPLIFAFNSQTSDNFRHKKKKKKMESLKMLTNFEKNFGHFGPENPCFFFFFFFYAFHWKTLFLCALSLKDPLFLTQFVTKRPLHLRCLVALVRHFHIWVPPGVGTWKG